MLNASELPDSTRNSILTLVYPSLDKEHLYGNRLLCFTALSSDKTTLNREKNCFSLLGGGCYSFRSGMRRGFSCQQTARDD